jgi:hypothetical protein
MRVHPSLPQGTGALTPTRAAFSPILASNAHASLRRRSNSTRRRWSTAPSFLRLHWRHPQLPGELGKLPDPFALLFRPFLRVFALVDGLPLQVLTIGRLDAIWVIPIPLD